MKVMLQEFGFKILSGYRNNDETFLGLIYWDIMHEYGFYAKLWFQIKTDDNDETTINLNITCCYWSL